MVTEEDDEEEVEAQALVAAMEEENEDEGDFSVMSLSGLMTEKRQRLRTMKLKGCVGGLPILMLVDSRATQFHLQEIGRGHGLGDRSHSAPASENRGGIQGSNSRGMQEY